MALVVIRWIIPDAQKGYRKDVTSRMYSGRVRREMEKEHFSLQADESKTICDSNGRGHTIRVVQYRDNTVTLYHPVSKNEDPNQLVVIVDSELAGGSSYDHVYASCVTGSWDVIRDDVVLLFEVDPAKNCITCKVQDVANSAGEGGL